MDLQKDLIQHNFDICCPKSGQVPNKACKWGGNDLFYQKAEHKPFLWSGDKTLKWLLGVMSQSGVMEEVTVLFVFSFPLIVTFVFPLSQTQA